MSASGTARFFGRTMTFAADDPADGIPLGVLSARDAGAEITAASIVDRPEEDDLFLRIDLAHIPAARPNEGFSLPIVAPGTVYGANFTLGDVSYQVRMLPASATSAPKQPVVDPSYLTLPRDVFFGALHRCEDECIEIGKLSGGFGTAGADIRVSIPRSMLGVDVVQLSQASAFVALGEAATGPLAIIDQVVLPDGEIARASVKVGIEARNEDPGNVAFTTTFDPLDGTFAGDVDVSGLSPGAYTAWVEACLATQCGAPTPIHIEVP